MIESVSKPRLSKDLSYALKTSELARALDDANIDIHVDLVYWKPQVLGSMLEAQYWLPNENVSYPRVYVRAGCIPAMQRAVASESLSNTALPRFIDWLRSILSLPPNTPKPAGTLYFNATWLDDRLSITNEPQYKRRK
jgi:hypothetical protein